MRLRTYESGVTCAKKQCIKCGVGIGNTVSKAGVFEAWDYELEKKATEDYQQAVELFKRQEEEWRGNRPSESWWSVYDAYLASAVWAVKRELVLKRSGGTCEACGQAAAEQIHHMKYPKVFGLEPLWDLRAVCHGCHEIIHDREIPRRPR